MLFFFSENNKIMSGYRKYNYKTGWTLPVVRDFRLDDILSASTL
jgi:hypothetical protein